MKFYQAFSELFPKPGRHLFLQHGFLMTLFLAIFGYQTTSAQSCSWEAFYTVTVQGGNVVLTADNYNALWTYNWAWDDGTTTGGGTGPSYTFPTATFGTYATRLQVNTGSNLIQCGLDLDIAETCSGSADFDWSTPGCFICFTPVGNQTGVTFNYWDFDDGSPDNNQASPCHLFALAGTYDVVHAIVFNDPAVDNVTHVWFCEQEVEADCESGCVLRQDCCRLELCCENVIEADAHEWDFNDGSEPNEEENPCHYYTNLSTYELDDLEIYHEYTIGGIPYTETLHVDMTLFPGIYVGSPNITTSLDNVVSSIDATDLFPGNDIGNQMGAIIDVHVAGELEVDKNFDFDNIHFCMDPEAGFLVSADRTMGLEFGSHIENADKCAVWRSIDIQDESGFVGDVATIESALYGIRTISHDADVWLNEVDFNFNFIGIFAPDDFNLHQLDNCNFNGLQVDFFNWGTLDTEVPVPFALQGFAGILVDNNQSNGLSVPNGTGPNTNEFFNLANGIWSHDSNIRIQRCRFQDMLNYPFGNDGGTGIRFRDTGGGLSLIQTGLGIGTNPTTFENIPIAGIRLTTHGTGTRIDSEDNIMDNNVNQGYQLTVDGSLDNSYIGQNNITCFGGGIEVIQQSSNASELLIDANTISLNATVSPFAGIYINDDSGTPVAQDIELIDNIIVLDEGAAGIQGDNIVGVLIQDNVITINDDTDTPDPAGIRVTGGSDNDLICNISTATYTPTPHIEGVGIHADQSEDNIYSYNTTQGTRFGIEFEDFCGATSLIEFNTFTDNDRGLFYRSTSETGPQTNTGNMWSGMWPGGTNGAFHQSSVPLVLGASAYITHASQAPPNLNPSTGWFTTVGGMTVTPDPDCDQPALHGGDDMENRGPTNEEMFNAVDTAIADGSLAQAIDDEVHAWTLRSYLYGKLANIDINEGLFYEFMQNEAGTSVGELYEIGTEINDLFAFEPEVAAALDEYSESAHAAFEAIIAIDEAIAEGASGPELEDLMEDRAEWIGISHESLAAVDSIGQLWLEDRSTGAASLISANAGVSTEGDYDQNKKILNDLYFQTILQRVSLTLAQKETLLGIAEKCPQTGGPATHWARSWYYAETGQVIFPECEEGGGFDGGEMEEKQLSLSPSKIMVSPNPANEEINIAYSLPEVLENTHLEILDNTGILMKTVSIKDRENKIRVPVHDMPAGIYFIHILSDRQTILFEKFIIIK